MSEELNPPTPKWMTWAGRILTALPVPLLAMSAAMKFLQPEDAIKGTEALGWQMSVMVPLGIVEITCTALYLIPQTAVLGAILLTGYLGGATATHVRIGEPFIIPIALGVIVWGGLFLRDPRIRALIPLRR